MRAAEIEQFIARYAGLQKVSVRGGLGIAHGPGTIQASETCTLRFAGELDWWADGIRFHLVGYYPLETLLALADSV